MFNNTLAQKQIGYWVSNKWYLNKKINVKYGYIQIHMVITQCVNGRKEGRKEMFYLMMFWDIWLRTIQLMRMEKHILFDNTIKTFYLQLGHWNNENGNLLLPLHGILFMSDSKGTFICIISQGG